MQTFRYDLLLFCKERLPSKHLLYFAELDTLRADLPVLHCFSADKKLFETAALGGLYRLETKKSRIVSAVSDGEFDIEESYFSMLLELKTLRYDSAGEPAPFHPDRYYSFKELRSLLEYRESFARRTVNRLIRVLSGIPPLILPPAVYIGLLSWLLPKSPSMAAPFAALLALPLMLFLMMFCYALCHVGLLRLPRTRYGLLKAYALRHGGLRQGLKLSPAEKKRFALFGGVSAGLFALSVLLFLLF